jgi:leucine dehydrogenase
MTYKAALAGLPCGGGKAVIMSDGSGTKPQRLLAAYGPFLNQIGDRFATGEDVGFSPWDCDALRAFTPYVAGASTHGRGDTAAYTAQGVWHAIRHVAARLFGAADLRGLRIAVQGLGGVGWRLCERLADEGAVLTVADIKSDRAEAAAALFGAAVADPARVHAAEVDLWSPCAMGGVINDDTAHEIRCRAIVGSANNQLSRPELAETLRTNGILLAPDFVVSAGGLLSGADELARLPGRSRGIHMSLEQRLEGIGRRLGEVLDLAEAQQTTPHAAALRLAKEIVGEA